MVIVIDAFRWMTWCNLCLQAIRAPPRTAILRRLVTATRNLKVTDDKIIKLLGNILTK